MSGEPENSDSWGSLLIDGILIKMDQVSGKKSEDRYGDQEHLAIEPAGMECNDANTNENPVEKVSNNSNNVSPKLSDIKIDVPMENSSIKCLNPQMISIMVKLLY